jgi:hypothetical protein
MTNLRKSTYPKTNLCKHLFFAVTATLAAPVFAGDKQNVVDACYSNYDPVYFSKSAFPSCKQAAEQGDAKAQYYLGIMYHKGRGTLKDIIVAYIWYNVAASQANYEAASSRNELEKEMTRNQVDKAQKLTKEFYRKYVK